MNDLFFVIFGGVFVVLPAIGGLILKLFPPKEVNLWYGFRTEITTQSQKAWDYAHRICPNIMLIYAAITVVLYIVLAVINPSFLQDCKYVYLLIGFALAMVGVIITTVIVQSKTKKQNFEQDKIQQ